MTPAGKALLEPLQIRRNQTQRILNALYGCADLIEAQRWVREELAMLPATTLPVDEAAAPLRAALTAVSRKLWADADAIEDSQTGTQKARSIAAEALRAAAVEVDKALAAANPATILSLLDEIDRLRAFEAGVHLAGQRP